MPVFVGLFMSLAAVAVALLIAVTLGIGAFPHLVANCAENGLDEIACANGALKAGVYSTGASAAVLVISFLMWRYASRRQPNAYISINPIATKLVLAATMGVLITHYVTQQFGAAYASRMDDVVRYVNFVAIENLAWPFLLQLFVMESESRLRMGILTALAAIMAFTPYRAVYLAVVIFGFGVPILEETVREIRLQRFRRAISCAAKPAALAALIFICALWSGYVDSAGRDLTDLQGKVQQQAAAQAADQVHAANQAPAEASAQAPQLRVKNILQRLVHPLVQAALLEHLAAEMPVPSLMDEIRWKFRQSSRLPLSQFLYEKEYRSGQGVGGTTFLYYGEAAAYLPRLMLLWMLAAPLLVVVVWLALRAKIADVGTVCGIQIWRSSLAGIVTMLPALTIQVLTLLGMISFSRLLARSTSLKWLSGAATSVALLAVAMVVGLQCWAIVGGPSRNIILVMGLAPPQGCVFANWLDMPRGVDAVLADHGVKVASTLWLDERNASISPRSEPVMLEIPQGYVAKGFTAEIVERLAGNIDCAGKPTTAPPQLISEYFFDRKGNLPLELLVVVFGLLTLVAMFREMISSPLERNSTQQVLT